MSEVEVRDIFAAAAFFEPERITQVTFEQTLEWFALTVKPRFEKASACSLEMKGYEAFLPLVKKRHVYGGRNRESEVPLFPGYIFCRFNPTNRLPILLTPGVTRILGNGSGPMPVPDTEIVSLKTALQSHLSVHPFPFPPQGQKVRIRKGALAGIDGTIVTIKDRFRLVLSISLLQRSVLVEIDHDWVVSEAPAHDAPGIGSELHAQLVV